MVASATGSSLRELIHTVPVGNPKCIFVPCVSDALASVELGPVQGQVHRHVVVRWTSPPRIDSVFESVIGELASVARAVWPYWFGLSVSEDESFPEHEVDLQRLAESTRTHP